MLARVAVSKSEQWLNELYYGDNLDVLRERIQDESVDLIYLDPPFNSNRSYNVLFQEKSGQESPAQIEAFGDTWTWSHETEALYQEIVSNASLRVADALEAMRKLLGDNDVLAYLVMMTARLVELHRVLKSTGSLYLHCDPTASHYLKVMLDASFGPQRFVNEIIWKRSSAHSDAKQGSKHYGRVSDTLFFYSKSEERTWNYQYQPYDPEYVDRDYRRIEPETGRRYRISDLSGPGGAAKGNPSYEVMGVWRHWRYSKEKMDQLIAEGRVIQTRPGAVPQYKRYLDEMPGVLVQNVWTDVPVINNRSKEKLNYPTQKPLALLERIIEASSNEGDVVLDPFAGCGTAIDAAQKLGRRWIGIDVTTLAVDLIDARLRHTYGEKIRDTYEIRGIPRDLAGAKALFEHSPFEFERWCVMLLDGQPNEKQVGDKGIDGVIRFPLGKKDSGKVLVSVKGGATNPGHVRDLVGTVESQKAAMGVFVCMQKPTKGMVDAANHSGVYTYPVNDQKFPKVQIITVEELLDDKRPSMPNTLLPYFQAQRRYDTGEGDQFVMDL
ncbi:MAG: restriction endonuclease [Actinobacteria bacterium]|nr:restriction endonuclease [Actinomycetota bacterium]